MTRRKILVPLDGSAGGEAALEELLVTHRDRQIA
jgi:hypothetical protein